MVIDIHTHFTPYDFPDMSARSDGDRWPRMEAVDEYTRNVIVSRRMVRTLTSNSWNLEKRIEEMDREGIDVQVISPIPLSLSYWAKPEDALYFANHMNGQIAEVAHRYPDRFHGFGMLPLQDPELAADEVQNFKNKFGLTGIEVGTNIAGRPIGDPFFNPFFEAAEAENLPIFLHPLQPVGEDRLVGPSVLRAVVAFPAELGMAVSSLITGGVLERFPNLKIAVSHGGGSFYSILPRLVHGWNVLEPFKESLPQSPEVYAKKLFFDTLVYDDITLKHLIELFGTDQLLLGSDYPYTIREKNPGERIRQLALLNKEEENILKNNVLRFIGNKK